MPDESSSSTTNSATATPASNQNLIIGLVLGAVVLLLLFMVVSMQNGNTGSRTSEVDELKQELAILRADTEQDSRAAGLGPLGAGVNPQALANEISIEANALAARISEIGDEIRQKDLAIRNGEETRRSLNNRITDLQEQLGQLSNSASELVTLRNELDSTRTLLDAANRTIENLRKQLAQAPDSGTLEQLRSENENLRKQLADLRELESEVRDLRAENRRLQAQLDRSTLFVESADALPAIAQRLFRELERLEGLTPSELEQNYARIASQLNARVLRKVSFPTGSASLSMESIAQIRNDLATAPSNAFLLVVGYASTTGDFDTNRQLSSNRATAVASQVNIKKKPTQQVRAVFLNETNRFSPTQPPLNQICEIWEIRP